MSRARTNYDGDGDGFSAPIRRDFLRQVGALGRVAPPIPSPSHLHRVDRRPEAERAGSLPLLGRRKQMDFRGRHRPTASCHRPPFLAGLPGIAESGHRAGCSLDAEASQCGERGHDPSSEHDCLLSQAASERRPTAVGKNSAYRRRRRRPGTRGGGPADVAAPTARRGGPLSPRFAGQRPSAAAADGRPGGAAGSARQSNRPRVFRQGLPRGGPQPPPRRGPRPPTAGARRPTRGRALGDARAGGHARSQAL